MKIVFNKYQGAGNDFIMIDNLNNTFNPDNYDLVNKLCDRRFGIGADGLILICRHNEADFEMKYYNSDGKPGSMCGNGGRCTAHFAMKCGIAGNEQNFMAFDGIHKAYVTGSQVRLQMGNVNDFKIIEGSYFINTGSPHYVIFRDDVDSLNIYEEGKKIRWSPLFAPGGTNVNFVEKTSKGLKIRTFERGVEDETLACGTGVTASAIASVLSEQFDIGNIEVKARGGDLRVEFTTDGTKVSDVWLSGPATFVFEGLVDI